MPAKLRNSTRPCVYLDQSTLTDAFLAHHAPARTDKAYVGLRGWIEHVAHDANLCLSLAHAAETALWPSRDAVAFAEWLDRLPAVWMHTYAPLSDREEERLLKSVVGDSPPPIEFAAPSMWSTFGEWTPETTVEALADPSFHKLVSACAVRGAAYEHGLSMHVMSTFREDRAAVSSAGWTPKRRAERLAYNDRVEWRKRAIAAHDRLSKRADATYLRFQPDRGGIQDPFVERLERDPRALPTYRVTAAFNLGLASASTKRDPNSSKTAAEKSLVYDLLHVAAGAGYCEVFTCDHATDGFLGEVRPTLGLVRQLSVRRCGGPQAFVRHLMTTVP